MKILLTGQSGLLGQELLKILRTSNQVFSLSRSQLPLSVKELVMAFVLEIQPDAIINAAAWTDVDGAEENESSAFIANHDIPLNLALVSKKLEIPFIHISTDYVFSGIKQTPWETEDLRQPLSAYGRTKAIGEDAVLQSYPFGSIIFRTAWLYSPNKKNFVKSIIRTALSNKDEIKVVNDQIGQPTSAIDLAKQIKASLELKLKPGVYHATNSGAVTRYDFAKEIFKLIDEDPLRVKPSSSAEDNRIAPRPSNSVLSHKCWENSRITPMRFWRDALAEQIYEIKETVIEEGIL